jgi:hypothetical protein
MPSLQVVDLNPTPRTEKTTLEKFTEGFGDSYFKGIRDEREQDEIAGIYKEYLKEGDAIDKAIAAVKTNPKLSNAKRVEEADFLLKMKNVNTKLQKQVLKNNEKAEKALEEEETRKKEINFLESIEGKDLSSTGIYTQARKQGLSETSAGRLANLNRMEGKENRLTIKDINSLYEFDLKEIDRKLSDIRNQSKDKRIPLENQRDELVAMRKRDIDRLKKDKNLSETELEARTNARIAEEDAALQAKFEEEQAKQIEEQAKQQEKDIEDGFIQLITQTFPPDKVPIGTEKWVPANKTPDGKQRHYKSDGKKWVLVQ